MNRARHFLGQKRVYAALTDDTAVAGKSRRDNLDMEMRLAFRACAGVAGMALGVVAYDETRRLQRRSELCPNAIGDTHAIEFGGGDGGVKANNRRVIAWRKRCKNPNGR